MLEGKTRLSQSAEDVLTLQLAWAQFFPSLPCTDQHWLNIWLRYNPIETVIAAFEHASIYCTHAQSTEHLSKMITLLLKSVTYEK